MRMNEEIELVTPQLLGRYFPGLNARTLCNLRSRGKGPPYYKRERRVYYRLDEVRSWLTEVRVVPRAMRVGCKK